MKLDYDEVSPITGNKVVMCEETDGGDVWKLCMESGYQTWLNGWKSDSEEIEQLEQSLPITSVQTKVIDDNDNIWYRTMLIDPAGTVVLMPERDANDGSDVWVVYPLKVVSEQAQTIVYAKKLEDGDGNERTLYVGLAIEYCRRFPIDQFEKAFDVFTQISNLIIQKHENMKEDADA